MDAPLYRALCAHRALGRASFHTPGHKSCKGVLPGDLFSLDYTELPDTDSLFEASGAIHEAETAAAALFGSAGTFFSAGGCTLCIQAMLRLCAPQGGKLVVGRVIHRSAVNTMALLGIEPVWIMPRPDAGEGLPGRIYAEDVAAALKNHPEARGVYLTSPDYYGVLADIPAIAELCRRYGVPLLVDNAHGAHLKFVGGDLHPLTQGASITACSAHKTLPVLTGGAWLNVGERSLLVGAKEAMALFGSTSPSYPVMASLDLCRAWLAEKGPDAFSALQQRVAQVRRVAQDAGFTLPLGLCDPVRITLGTASVGYTGEQVAAYLRAAGVEPEYADGGHVVCIASPMNHEEDFLRLERALRALPKKTRFPLRFTGRLPRPFAAAAPREAVLAPAELVEVNKCAGRIAAEAACPCPPGVPVVMPGEFIGEDCVELLTGYGFSHIKVIK